MPIGPQLPPSADKRKRAIEDESGSSDSAQSVGPQLPPRTDLKENVVKKPRVLGPSLPSTVAEKPVRTPTQTAAENDDSSDDDFGPSLPTKADTDKIKSSQIANKSQASAANTSDTKTQSTRDEWMTLAPTSGDWSQRVDPTKLKNRKFNTGRSNATATPGTPGTDVWHETPEQKQARLQREVLGIKDDKGSRVQPGTVAISQDDAETARRMKEYSKQRGPSLYNSHVKSQKGEEDDDPSARAFDREKDIGGGLQINATQRKEMMKKSSDFNTRFSSARYL